MHKRSSWSVQTANEADLQYILSWLESEYAQDESGFWCNRGIIERSLSRKDLYVSRESGLAIGFLVGDHSPDIVSIKQDFKRRGIASALFDAALARAVINDVAMLQIECKPRNSWAFWKTQGFKPLPGAESEWGVSHAYRLVEKAFDLVDGVQKSVMVEFGPEALLRQNSEKFFETYVVEGTVLNDGNIQLPNRLVGVNFGEGDLAVRISVDGQKILFEKAKYDEAKRFGVQRDNHSAAFFIDQIAIPCLKN